MRRSRVVGSLAVASAASAALFLLAAPAMAYPPGNSSSASLSQTTFSEGGQGSVSGSGFKGGEQVDGYAHSARVFLGSTTANANGVASLSFTLPTSLAPGHHTIELVGETSGHVATAPFTIAAGSASSTSSSGSGLPFTGGNDIWQLTGAGVGLVLVGGAAVVAVRRRRGAGLAA